MDLRYTAVVVFLCLTIPVVAGLLIWPAEQEDVPEWQPSADKFVNITPTIDVSDAPNTAPYNGADNNMFMFSNGLQLTYHPYVRDGVTLTSTRSAFVAYNEYGPAWSYNGSLILPAGSDIQTDAQTLWATLQTAKPAAYTGATEFVLVNNGGTMTYHHPYFTFEGKNYDFLMIYKNGRAQLIDYVSGEMADVTTASFTYTVVDSSVPFMVSWYNTPASATRYIDVSDGFGVSVNDPIDYELWTNGYINHEMYLLIKPDETLSSNMNRIIFGTSSNELTIKIDSGNILVSYHPSSALTYDEEDLGTIDAYPYLLVMVDSDTKLITIYSLTDIGGFNQLYTDNLALSASFDYNDGTFTGMRFMEGKFSYYVARTSVENGTITAIVDANIKPASFMSGQEWATVIKNPSVIGDYLEFSDGVHTWTYPIKGGKIEIILGDDELPRKVAVRDMVIANVLIDNTLTSLINGEPTSFHFTEFTMGGVWKSDVWIYGVDWKTHSEYFWNTGAYGFDLAGHCIVGILTAGSCFVVLGLAYTRKGWGDEMGMIMAALMGVVYLYLWLSLDVA